LRRSVVEAWQLAVAVSLGVVLGELVFGGRGFGFVNPAAATLALLVFSFPQLTLVAPEMTVALATLPGAVLLLVAGLISWRVLLATLLIALAAIGFTSTIWDPISLAITLSVGLVFLVADPLERSLHEPRSLGLRRAGRFSCVPCSAGFSMEGLSAEAVVFAALLASLFAPLIDHLVVLANAYNRERRHARGQHG
jgi:Na+-transporting NADH:ubiquinone oxidoreductase subunit B